MNTAHSSLQQNSEDLQQRSEGLPQYLSQGLSQGLEEGSLDSDDESPLKKRKNKRKNGPPLRQVFAPDEWEKFKTFRKGMNKFIGTTRFTDFTWKENQTYMNRIANTNTKTKCIYATPIIIKKRVEPDSLVFVLEMNNTTNQIMGIGLIRNHPLCRKHRIHSNENYNRYSYTGIYHISREDIHDKEEQEIIKAFDTLCFKGSKHMKRGMGITLFPDEILFRCMNIIHLVEYVSYMFKKRMVAT